LLDGGTSMPGKKPKALFDTAERAASGKALRERVPRSSHSHFKPSPHRDAIKTLIQSSEGRVKHLIPIRYGRMLQSPFAFYRGAAAVMAGDLSRTPATGIRVQACGDCHLEFRGLRHAGTAPHLRPQ
jgi:hypothetical protein